MACLFAQWQSLENRAGDQKALDARVASVTIHSLPLCVAIAVSMCLVSKGHVQGHMVAQGICQQMPYSPNQFSWTCSSRQSYC